MRWNFWLCCVAASENLTENFTESEVQRLPVTDVPSPRFTLWGHRTLCYKAILQPLFGSEEAACSLQRLSSASFLFTLNRDALLCHRTRFPLGRAVTLWVDLATMVGNSYAYILLKSRNEFILQIYMLTIQIFSYTKVNYKIEANWLSFVLKVE